MRAWQGWHDKLMDDNFGRTVTIDRINKLLEAIRKDVQ